MTCGDYRVKYCHLHLWMSKVYFVPYWYLSISFSDSYRSKKTNQKVKQRIPINLQPLMIMKKMMTLVKSFKMLFVNEARWQLTGERWIQIQFIYLGIQWPYNIASQVERRLWLKPLLFWSKSFMWTQAMQRRTYFASIKASLPTHANQLTHKLINMCDILCCVELGCECN